MNATPAPYPRLVADIVGYIDVAVFQMEYTNMMEFVYGVWSSTNIGFSSRNIGYTRITGIDITWFNQGKFGKIPLNIFAGYTNINPIKTDYNPVEDTVSGTANFTILKYRYRQMLKADVETGYGKFLMVPMFVTIAKWKTSIAFLQYLLQE